MIRFFSTSLFLHITPKTVLVATILSIIRSNQKQPLEKKMKLYCKRIK